MAPIAPVASFKGGEAEMCELRRVGTHLGHDDAQIGVEPGGTDRLLHEAALIRIRAEILVDVDARGTHRT